MNTRARKITATDSARAFGMVAGSDTAVESRRGEGGEGGNEYGPSSSLAGRSMLVAGSRAAKSLLAASLLLSALLVGLIAVTLLR